MSALALAGSYYSVNPLLLLFHSVMRLFLIRHGETQWNRDGRIQGQVDVPLADSGREQARLLAKRLARVRFDAVYASDLTRTWETVQQLLAVRGDSLTATPEPGLREIAFGDYEGLGWEEVRRRDPHVEYRIVGEDPDLDLAPPNGESVRQLFTRQQAVARMLLERHIGQQVLVVGHGGAHRALAAALLDDRAEGYWLHRSLRPTSVSLLEYHQGRCAVRLWNDVAHIGDDIP